MDSIPSSGRDKRLSGGVASIDIVIVNWNAGKQLSEAIESIAKHGNGLVASVTVVDNGSRDESLKGLNHNDMPVLLVRNAGNRGFAVACNQGAKQGKAGFVLFLNPDTRLSSRSLSVPLEFMEAPGHEDVGICGVQLVDKAGTVTRACARFPTLGLFIASALGIDRLPGLARWSIMMRDWDHKDTRPVDQVMGAFFFMRRELFESLGGFDERFFVYFEDVDLSIRARQAQRTSVYLADGQVFHAGGGTTRQIKARRLYYSLASRLQYAFKHFARPAALGVFAVTLLIEPVTRLVFALGRGRVRDALYTLQAYVLLIRALPNMSGRRVKAT